MPTIGWFEILIVVAISVVIIGPKDFPFMLKKIGSWIGTIKRQVINFQNEITNLENENIDINQDLKKTNPIKKEKKNEQK